MASKTLPAVVAHGAARLPSVQVDDYNVELQDDQGFIGDRASKNAFRDIVSHWRTVLQNAGVDPLGDEDTHALSKKALDECLTRGDPKTAGIVQGVIEEFSQEFAVVIRRFPLRSTTRSPSIPQVCPPSSSEGWTGLVGELSQAYLGEPTLRTLSPDVALASTHRPACLQARELRNPNRSAILRTRDT
jgi:hypothetical protein